VTDAHVVLGHFPGTALLGGDFKLDEARAREALNELANEMSAAAGRRVSTISAARGVLEVVNTNMERALRHISVERGHDPREFTLIPFGGAGGFHAVALARALRIPRVMLPPSPGALSAVGVVTADVVKDQSRTVMLEAAGGVESKLDGVFRELERLARATLRSEGFVEAEQHHERSLAVRYKGQSFELQIKQPRGDIAAAFHRAHRARYGYAQENNVVEIVSARVRSSGLVEKLSLRVARGPRATNLAQPHNFTETYFAGKKGRAAVYRREEVKSGSRLRAPCIVTEYSATTLIPEGCKASVDALGNMIIEVGKL
jgi:N-methylhydantoinase A